MMHRQMQQATPRMPSNSLPLFRADWLNAVFLHFRVDANALQPMVPLELDRFDGDAFVSLVAFTQARLRPAVGGRWVEWLSAPLARHAFLNLRTYVRRDGTHAIYFLAEWIPNRLAALIGPRTYGLPYRLGQLSYANDVRLPEITGRVVAPETSLVYRAALRSQRFAVAEPQSFDAFALERYTAFTCRHAVIRRFDVTHKPWSTVPLDATLVESDLPASVGAWWHSANLVAAHYSPGVYDVGISAPARVAHTRRRPCPSRLPPE